MTSAGRLVNRNKTKAAFTLIELLVVIWFGAGLQASRKAGISRFCAVLRCAQRRARKCAPYHRQSAGLSDHIPLGLVTVPVPTVCCIVNVST